MRSLFFLFSLLIFLWLGCGQNNEQLDQDEQTVAAGEETAVKETEESASEMQLTEIGNFEFVHHIQNEGPKPQPGNIVQYNYQLRQGNKVMVNTFGQKATGAYFPTDEEAQKDPKPVVEALRRMSVGDSLTLVSWFSEDPWGFYKYDIKVTNIIALDKNTLIQKAENEAQPATSGQ